MVNGASEFLEKIKPVVFEHYPNFIDVWDLEESRYAEQLANNGSLRSLYGKSIQGEFGLGLGDVSLMADVLAVLSAAWVVVKWLGDRISTEPLISVEQALTTALVNEGMSAEQATRIAKKMSRDFAQQMCQKSS